MTLKVKKCVLHLKQAQLQLLVVGFEKAERKGKLLGCCPRRYYAYIVVSKLLIRSTNFVLIDPKPEESYKMLKIQNILNEALIFKDKKSVQKISLKLSQYLVQHTLPNPLWHWYWYGISLKDEASKLLFIALPLIFCSGKFCF